MVAARPRCRVAAAMMPSSGIGSWFGQQMPYRTLSSVRSRKWSNVAGMSAKKTPSKPPFS